MLSLGRSVMRGGSPRVAFDSVNIGQHITLSGDGLTATYGANGTFDLARTTTSHGSGKFYAEMINHTPGGGSQTNGIGLFPTATTLHANASSSVSYKGIAVIPQNGFVDRDGTHLNSGTQLNGGGPFADGSVVCFAIDLDNKLFWTRYTSTGQWNASGTANPATGAGGYDISSLTGPFFLGVLFSANEADSIALKLASGSWAGAAPSGFTPWF